MKARSIQRLPGKLSVKLTILLPKSQEQNQVLSFLPPIIAGSEFLFNSILSPGSKSTSFSLKTPFGFCFVHLIGFFGVSLFLLYSRFYLFAKSKESQSHTTLICRSVNEES